MKYFIDKENGAVYAYENQEEREQWGDPNLVEMTPGEVSEHLTPRPDIPTYQEELGVLNKQYQEDVEVFNKAFSLAIMFDGVTEEAKKVTIREQYAERKNKYVADLGILRIKHGV